MAKAHGFGSVQITINNIFFRVNPIMYKRVNGSRCKNRLIDTGYAKLREWDGAGKEWYDVPRIQKLRKLLTYETENKRKVEYPELKKEKDGDLPGYVELGKKENWLFKDRVECLTTPWSPWHPHKIPPPTQPKSEAKQGGAKERGHYNKPRDSFGGQKGVKDVIRTAEKKKSPPLPVKKHEGVIKKIEKEVFWITKKDDGRYVHAQLSSVRDGKKIWVGAKVKFFITEGTIISMANDVEIVE